MIDVPIPSAAPADGFFRGATASGRRAVRPIAGRIGGGTPRPPQDTGWGIEPVIGRLSRTPLDLL